MTKKHFIALANAIRHAREYSISGVNPFSLGEIQILADFCQSQNTRFNRDRWIDYIYGKCGPNGGAR